VAKIIPNIGLSALLDPVTQALEGVFSKMDSVVLDVDGKLTPVYGGSGMYSIVNISADRKPKVTLKGPEIPLTPGSKILGANQTVAAAGTPVQIPLPEEYTIPSTGIVTLNNPISATVISTSVMGALDGKLFTTVASAPTTGQYVTPIASATTITFAVADAGKAIYIFYSFDSTTGGQIDVLPTSVPADLESCVSSALITSCGLSWWTRTTVGG